MRPIIILILLAGSMSPASRSRADETSSDTNPAPKNHPARPDVLSLIPADVELAVSIPSLAVLDVQAASMLNRFDRLASSGVLAPMLEWLEIVDGVDRSRSAAIAVWPAEKRHPAEMEGAATPSGSRKMALFIPTDSLPALIRFHSPSPIGSGSFRVTIRGKSAWVAEMAGQAVFTTDENTLRAIQQSSRSLRDGLTKETLDQWSASEAVVFGNPSAGRPGATLFSLSPSMAPRLAPIAELLQRANRWSCGLTFEPDGLAMDILATTSPARKSPSAAPAIAGGFLGIPLEPIACAFAVRDTYAIDNHALPVIDMFLSNRANGTDDVDNSLRDAVRGLLNGLDGFSFSVSSAADATGPRINLALTAKLQAQPTRLRGAIESLVKALADGSFANPRLNQVMSRLALKPSVESAGGVTIDHLLLDTKSFEGLNRQAIKDAFGTDEVTLRLAIVDDRHLVATLGGGQDRFLGVVNALRSGRSPIDANARMIRAAKHIGKGGFVQAYLSPGRLSSLWQTMARLIDNATDQPVEERATELIGLSAGVTPSDAYRIHLFLPDDALAGILAPPTKRAAGKSRR